MTGYETMQHYSLSPQLGGSSHSPAGQSMIGSMYLSSPVGVRPGYSKTMKPLRTVREEQGRDGDRYKRYSHGVSVPNGTAR